MDKLYIMVAAECEKTENGIKVKDECIEAVKRQGEKLAERLNKYGNCIYTGPSVSAKNTAFFLKSNIQRKDKVVSYKEVHHLTDIYAIKDFIKDVLKNAIYNDCIVITKQPVCDALIELLVHGNFIKGEEICCIRYNKAQGDFIYEDTI